MARRQASRDYTVEPRRGPKRSAANSLSRVEVERLRRALLDMLESTKRIQRLVVKPNAARPGWLPAAAPDPAWTASPDVSPGDVPPAVEGSVRGAPDEDAGPDVAIAEEDGTVPPEPVLDRPAVDAVDALARAIVRTFDAPGRGFNGNRYLCESEDHLRQYLAEDGAIFDDATLAAALTRLETRLPNSNHRLLRGTELSRRNGGSRWLPATQLPARAMMLDELHPFDSLSFEAGY